MTKGWSEGSLRSNASYRFSKLNFWDSNSGLSKATNLKITRDKKEVRSGTLLIKKKKEKEKEIER